MRKLRILDLFSGTGSATKAFQDAGHEVVRVEYDERFEADLYADIHKVSASELFQLGTGGLYDFVWASPPCTTFSVASISTHWNGGKNAYIPKTQAAIDGMKLVSKTVTLINQVTKSDGLFVIENPRGVLRKLEPVTWLHRDTVWYCQYEDAEVPEGELPRAKPTDLWNNLPEEWVAKGCKNGADDHQSAPRGAKTGTQGLKKTERSMVPIGLGKSIIEAMEKSGF